MTQHPTADSEHAQKAFLRLIDCLAEIATRHSDICVNGIAVIGSTHGENFICSSRSVGPCALHNHRELREEALSYAKRHQRLHGISSRTESFEHEGRGVAISVRGGTACFYGVAEEIGEALLCAAALMTGLLSAGLYQRILAGNGHKKLADIIALEFDAMNAS
jgi:hypothetical protein